MSEQVTGQITVVDPDDTAMRLAAPVMTAQDIVRQTILVREIMDAVMHEDMHYGKIPGAGNKPVLFQAGAQKLAVVFRLSPTYEIEPTIQDGHREYTVRCTLRHIATNDVIAQGVGLCSTRESKYAYRKKRATAQVCPACGTDAIIKGRPEYGGGWVCYGKKGGCGMKWDDNDPTAPRPVSGLDEKVENPDIADTFNTVLKMAKKRAFVDAILTATACGDLFTQDIEDLQSHVPDAPPERKQADDAPPPQPPKQDAHAWAKGNRDYLSSLLYNLKRGAPQEWEHKTLDDVVLWVEDFAGKRGYEINTTLLQDLVIKLKAKADAKAPPMPEPDPPQQSQEPKQRKQRWEGGDHDAIGEQDIPF